MLPIEIESIRAQLNKQVADLNAELLEIQFRRLGTKCTLTFIIDKEGGVTLEDCARINRRLSDYFDELSEAEKGASESILQGSYYLEVNSPGLDRPLKTERDYTKALGDTVKVVYKNEVGHAIDFIGDIREVKEGVVTFYRHSNKALFALPLETIIKANREIRF